MKKIITLLLALILCFSLCACGSNSTEGASDNSNGVDKSEIVYDALLTAKDSFDFVSKYAGNVNGKGERAFSDDSINRLRHSLEDIDFEYINSNLPETAAQINTIQNNIAVVADLLVDMGITNSDANVPQMKQISLDTIKIIDELFSSELSAYNNL